MKKTKGIGFGKFYFKSPQQTVVVTNKVKAHDEHSDQFNSELSEKLDLPSS
jgi:hypothetical protein